MNIQIKLTSVNRVSLNIYAKFIETLLDKREINYTSADMPKQISRITLLKSPHVYKKAREQFEVRTFKKSIALKRLPLVMLKFFMINKPNGLRVSVKKIGG